MPTYEFETPLGDRREHFYHMSERPELGKWITVDGECVRRIISGVPEPRVYERRHVSHSLPRKGSGIERVWNKFTADGKPYFEGTKDVNDFKSRSEGSWSYD